MSADVVGRGGEGGSESEEEELVTVIENSERPSKLQYQKRRIMEGRRYIETGSCSRSREGEEWTDVPLPLPSTSEETEKEDEHMVSFVASDLQERIRMSSPPHSAGTLTSSSSSPSPYPPLVPDAQVLLDLESHAHTVSSQLSRILQEFNGSLHGMTDLTVECMDIYGSNVSKTCDSVDGSIKSMYQMLAKAEELTKILKPIPRLAQQIREIKRILDLFESHMNKSAGY